MSVRLPRNLLLLVAVICVGTLLTVFVYSSPKVPKRMEDALESTHHQLKVLTNIVREIKNTSHLNIPKITALTNGPLRTSLAPIQTVFKPWATTKLDEQPKLVKVMDLKRPSNDTHQCVKLANLSPPVRICIHSKTVDVWVSGAIAKGQFWEGGNVNFFMKLLNANPALNVIDIGCNIGQYTLIGAQMGRKVLSVEARLLHVEMVRHSIQINNFQESVTLVHNAVADERKKVSLSTYSTNQGGTHVVDVADSVGGKEDMTAQSILMGDLAGVIPFDKALMKIDIEGYENKALHYADPLFDKVFIPFIIMEWNGVKPKPKEEIEPMLGWFESRGYEPFQNTWPTLSPIKMEDWKKWPFDIVFKHRSQSN